MTVKISNLPAATSLGDGDLIPIVQGGTTKKLDFVGDAVTQSDTDTTAGRLLKVGDFGVGSPQGSSVIDSSPSGDLPGMINVTYATNDGGNRPSGFGGLLSLRGSSARYAQIAISTATPADRMYFRQGIDGTEAAWQELYHTGNIGNIDVASGDFSVDVSGSPDLFIEDGTGNVGIGTTAPSAQLDVSLLGTPVVKIQSTASSAHDAKLVLRGARTVSTTGDFCQILFETNDEDSTGDSIGFITAGKDVASTNQGVIRFGTTATDGGTPTERMRIDSNGNVGINVTNPARRLHIDDTMRLEPRATAPSSPAKGDIYFDSSDDKLKCYDGTVWQDLF